MKQNTTIEQQVMASVAVVYAARQLTSATALKVYALGVSLAGVAAFVSVPHVAANFIAVESGGLGSITSYLLSAVTGTRLVVQLALGVATVAGVSFVVDAARSLLATPRSTLATQRA